jgi:hypothetical protein
MNTYFINIQNDSIENILSKSKTMVDQMKSNIKVAEETTENTTGDAVDDTENNPQE